MKTTARVYSSTEWGSVPTHAEIDTDNYLPAARTALAIFRAYPEVVMVQIDVSSEPAFLSDIPASTGGGGAPLQILDGEELFAFSLEDDCDTRWWHSGARFYWGSPGHPDTVRVDDLWYANNDPGELWISTHIEVPA